MILDSFLKDKSRLYTCVAIAALMLLTLLLPPVSMVLADDEELIFPNFEEADLRYASMYYYRRAGSPARCCYY